MDQVRPGGLPVPGGLPEGGQGRLKVQVSQRFQELSCWSYVHGHVDLPVVMDSQIGALPGAHHSGCDDVLQIVLTAVEFEGVGPECVGEDNVAPGLKVLSVDIHDLLCVLQVPDLRQFPGAQSLLLEKGSHAAVKKQQLFS